MTAVLETPTSAPARSRRARPEGRHAGAALAVQALQLLGRWQRVSNGHIALAAGCACGHGAGVDLREIDELIFDFLQNRFREVPVVGDFLRGQGFTAQGREEPRASLALLLRSLAAQPDALPRVHAGSLLQALDGSITSIEEQHR
jgi:hypothetical protein